jgi:hypothetical protein
MTTDAVSRSSTANQNEETIVRYTFFERINHWIGALSYTYLLVTGLAFWSPYLYWLAAVVGGGPAARLWHPWFGLIFTLSIFVTFVQWRGDMEINDADRAWGRAIPDYIENEDEKLPPVGRFNFGQKLFFWAIFYRGSPVESPLPPLRRDSDSRQRGAHHDWIIPHPCLHERGPRRRQLWVHDSRLRDASLGLDIPPHLVLRRHRQTPALTMP